MFDVYPGTYLVFGASGLIGSHALMALANRPDVEVYAQYHSRLPRVKASNINPYQIDLRAPQPSVDAMVSRVDYAFIFSGILASSPVLKRDPVGPVVDTARIAINALETCVSAGIKKLVWLSSTTAYPAEVETLSEDQIFVGAPPESWSGIGTTYRYIESLCSYLCRENDTAITALRPSLVYGEYDHFSEEVAHFLPSMIRQVVSGNGPVQIWGDGEQRRDLIYAGDVVKAALRTLERETGCAAYNISAGRSWSVNECVDLIMKVAGAEALDVEHIERSGSVAPERRFPNDLAKKDLGFSVDTSLEDGLSATINWYKENRTDELI